MILCLESCLARGESPLPSDAEAPLREARGAGAPLAKDARMATEKVLNLCFLRVGLAERVKLIRYGCGKPVLIHCKLVTKSQACMYLETLQGIYFCGSF